MKKLTLEEIKDRLNNINPNIEIISKEYTSSANKMECRCKICGYMWLSPWSNLQVGKGCKRCAVKKTTDKQRYTIEIVKEKLKNINSNIEIISNEYNNNETKLTCKCLIDNHIWKATWGNLSTGQSCPMCANNIKLTLCEVKRKIKDINANIEILSDKYISNKEHLKCRCIICDKEWESRFDNLSQGYGCPQCGIQKITGKNSYRWNGGVSSLSEYLRKKIVPWKKDSIKNCKYKCDITGKRFDTIHHLYGFDNILKEVLSELNMEIFPSISEYSTEQLELLSNKCLEVHYRHELGVCLCEEEHVMFHNIYGYGNNTKEQYEEFKSNRLKNRELGVN